MPRDADVVVLVAPRTLAASRVVTRLLEVAVPDVSRATVRARTGIDPGTVDELVVASVPGGWLALARGPFRAGFAVREAGSRLSVLESSTDAPRIRRAGLTGSTRREYVALADDALLVVDGEGPSAAPVVAALTAPSSVPSWREAADVQRLFADHRDAAFVLFATRPLSIPQDAPVHALLGGVGAMAVRVDLPLDASERLTVRIDARGVFPEHAEDLARGLFVSIASDALGAALGLRDAAESLRLVSEPGRLEMRVDLDASVLARGLTLLWRGEISDMLGPAESVDAR